MFALIQKTNSHLWFSVLKQIWTQSSSPKVRHHCLRESEAFLNQEIIWCRFYEFWKKCMILLWFLSENFCDEKYMLMVLYQEMHRRSKSIFKRMMRDNQITKKKFMFFSKVWFLNNAKYWKLVSNKTANETKIRKRFKIIFPRFFFMAKSLRNNSG